MPLIIPEDFGQSETLFQIISTPTFGLVVLGHSFGLGVPTPEDGANAIMDSWDAAGIEGLLSNVWQVKQVDLTIMSATGPITGTSTRSPLVGTGSPTGAAPQISGLCRKNTQTGGRAGRGRLYIPGLDEALISPDGFLSSSYFGGFQTIMTNFRNELVDRQVSMRILHSNPAISPSEVTSLSAQNQVATQRRRNRR